MNKYPILLQDEEKACGAYCIAMILQFYGYQEEMKEIKKKARLNRNGISIKGIIECFKEYQIESKAYEASLQDIQNHVKLPCILYMIYEDIGHFVVLYDMKGDEYIIGDPARGLLTLYREEMIGHYTSRLIAITHVGRVPQIHYQTYSSFLKKLFLSYRQHMISCIIKGVEISLLGYFSSYFFQYIIDDVHIDTHFFYIIVMCITYGVIEIMKTHIEKIKTRKMISLQKAIDEELVFQSSMNMLSLPQSFFYQDKGYIQSELLSMFDLSEMSLTFFERLFLDGLSFIVFICGLFFLNFYMSLLVLGMYFIIGFISHRCLKQFQHLHKSYLESHFVYQHHLLELIENHFLIQRFSLLQKQREKSYDIYLDEALQKEKRSIFMNYLQTFIQYIIYIFYTMILILGFFFFQHHLLTIGQLMMFYMLVSYCMQPVLNLVSLTVEYQQMEIIYEKYKLFDKEETICKNAVKENILSIRFDNVSYAHGYQLPIFEHVDWVISRHYLLKGLTGSGKSTLLKLLMGYDLHYSGDIYINDQELRTIDLQSLYQHIGYTNETPTFLHTTLLSNFLCHDEKRIKQYLKIFGQENLIHMFSVVLCEDGSPLSLGQRQVVALIRLLCQDYDILILDEAFSHMDSRLAGRVIRYLLKNDKNKIYVIVSHQTRAVFKELGCAKLEQGCLKIEK